MTSARGRRGLQSAREIRALQAVDSLDDYVQVAQHQAKIVRFAKQAGVWLPRESVALGGKLTLASIGITLAVSEIYEGLVRDDGRIWVV